MRVFCFTADLDRDVNIRIPGAAAAGSADRGDGNSPRFGSARAGLDILLEILRDAGVKATFFAEGRTLENVSAKGLSEHEVGVHGYDHEDMTSMSGQEIRECLGRAVRSVRVAAGRDPVSFRAPYMKINETVLGILPEFGIRYDSSMYAQMGGSIRPRMLSGGVTEVPVPEGRDRSGNKIAAYLWPMHEGKRMPEDYVNMASEIREDIFVLATHTWHMAESRDRGIMAPDEVSRNAENVRAVIDGIVGMGFEPMSVSDAAEYFQNGKD
ncbi:MAG: polysaccharide deacetylase family protein [Candidatus Methanoplasma sp.]|jgi:peptidoglycan/xylan/chitin deacetylase (PgdA/CDA1 family)|nr:polysaccharide deacetylase family protein [Candidatus Methanoplasma sp.]